MTCGHLTAGDSVIHSVVHVSKYQDAEQQGETQATDKESLAFETPSLLDWTDSSCSTEEMNRSVLLTVAWSTPQFVAIRRWEYSRALLCHFILHPKSSL